MFGKTLIINDWVKKDSQNSYNLDSEQGSPEGAGQDTLSTHVSNCIEYIGVYNSQCERSRLWMKGMRLRKVLQYKCIPLRQKKSLSVGCVEYSLWQACAIGSGAL